MKKLLIFLLLLVTFPFAVLADGSCGIEKDPNENYILKSGDVVTVYLYTNLSNESPKISSFSAQLYYNPYIFDLMEDYNGKFFFLNEGWSEKTSKKYSSILQFQISGSDLTIPLLKYDSSNILSIVRFKVKDNIKNQNTTIELMGDKFSNMQVLYAGDGESFKIDCMKTILSYEINNNATSNMSDSKLSSVFTLAADDGYAYMNPEFNPIITSYDIYTESSGIFISGECASRECDTESKNYNLKYGNNTIKIKSTAKDGTNTTYTFNVVREESEYDFYYPVLDNLNILNYSLIEEFDSYLSTYHLVVPSTEDSLFIDYETDDANTVNIYNNDNFVTGENIVTVEVSDYKGNYKNKYYIVVNKTEKVDDKNILIPDNEDTKTVDKTTSNKIYILFAVGVALFVVIYVVIDILFNKKIKFKKK